MRPPYPVRRQGIQSHLPTSTKEVAFKEGNTSFYFSYLTWGWRRSGQIGALSTYIRVEAALRTLRIASETSHRVFRGLAREEPTLTRKCAKLGNSH